MCLGSFQRRSDVVPGGMVPGTVGLVTHSSDPELGTQPVHIPSAGMGMKLERTHKV